MSKRLIDAILESQAEGENMAAETEKVVAGLMKRAGMSYLGPVSMSGPLSGRYRLFLDRGKVRVEQAIIIPLPSDLLKPTVIQTAGPKPPSQPIPVMLGWDQVFNHRARQAVFKTLLTEMDGPTNNRPNIAVVKPDPEDMH